MKAFIIYLPDIETSVESSKRVLDSLLSYGLEAELFEGTRGDVARDQFDQENRIYHEWGIKGPYKKYSMETRLSRRSPGEMGCFDSHYRLWQKCVELDEPIMIFEDDVVFTREYIPVEFEEVLAVATSHAKKMAKYPDHYDGASPEPQAMHYGQGSMPGNAGYVIKPHAAQKLLDEYSNTFLPADNAINQHLVKIELHSHLMGKARTKHEGNISTIRTKIWDN